MLTFCLPSARYQDHDIKTNMLAEAHLKTRIKPLAHASQAFDRLFGGRGENVSDEVRDELLRTEYTQLQRQIPALYATIAVANVATTAAIHYDSPTASWVIAPAILTLVIVVRLLLWFHRRGELARIEDVRKHLKGTTLTAFGLAALAGFWTLQSFNDAPESMRILLPVCTLLSAFAVVNCLASLRLAATGVLALGAFPVISAMLVSGERMYLAVGSCALMVSVLQLRLIAERYRHNVSRIELQHQMKQLADTDMLTRLPNRRAFFAQIEDILQRENGSGGFAVALLDLDGFKQINDRLGHQAGDAVLQAVADRLSSHADSHTHFGRIGGDEFAILFDLDEPLTSISARATGVMASLAEPCVVAGRRLAISASLGLAQFPGDGGTLGELFLAADTALYAAKLDSKLGSTAKRVESILKPIAA
jgi:diguanylate cyclase